MSNAPESATLHGGLGEIIRIIDVPSDRLVSTAEDLRRDGGRLKMVYARWLEGAALELRYLAEPEDRQGFILWRCRPESGVPSLTPVFPLIGWDEREIMDLYGLSFSDHPEPRSLVLHRGVAAPGRPDGAPHRAPAPASTDAEPEEVIELSGSDLDVQALPFGPVRAGVVESGAFLFDYVGEHVLQYQPQLFFKHRGMEMRFEGLRPLPAVILAERVSGVGSVAHALGYCQAVEAASACQVPRRARWLRVMLGELERIYNHLHYLGHLADTTTLKVGHAEGMLLEERAKQINARLTGSRFLRSLLVPGGLRRDLEVEAWLWPALRDLRVETGRYTGLLKGSDSFNDRLLTTGILPEKVAFDEGATGPVARASNLDRDFRRDHPYAAYDELVPELPVEDEGDAHARFHVRVAELEASFELVATLLTDLPSGPVRADCVVRPDSEGLGWAESPRGALVYAVHIAGDGMIARVKIKSPSFSNWRAFPFTVHDSDIMDYAINEASFGLTIAGCDR